MSYAEIWRFLDQHVEHALLEKMGEQDIRALNAFAELCRLYKVADTAGKSAAVVGMAAAASATQKDVRRVLRWVIAHVLDWADVDPLWGMITEGFKFQPDPVLGKMLSEVGLERARVKKSQGKRR